jgi:hypothetical protein
VTLKEIIDSLIDEARARGPVVRLSEVVEAGEPRVLAHPELAEALMREGLQHRVKAHMQRRHANGAA